MNWRLAVVGSPISHSLSPQLHEAGLQAARLRGTSQRFECGRDELGTLRSVALANFDALSVTSPLKADAVSICDKVSEVAQRARGVNSIVVRGASLEATSTDGDGFVAAFEYEFGTSLRDLHVAVIGSGGAASAIVEALVRQEASSVALYARNHSSAGELASRFDRVSVESVDSPAVDSPAVDLVVNTTPSLSRRAGEAFVPGVHADTVAIDISYDPRMSAWRQRYQDYGCRTSNGLAMLAFQAALQMQWWWGVALDGVELLEVLQ